MDGLAPKASALALKHLMALGVEVLLNSSEATALPGEVVYESVSPEVATGFLDASLVDEKNRVRVNEFLQVCGHPNWYALGDASAVADPKHGANAAAQAEYVARHLLNALSDKPKVLRPYALGRLVAIVPIGRTHGIGQLPFGVVAWKFLINLKRKDFFIGRFRREFGLGK